MADKKVLGFIGIGVMGHSMAGHLLEAGWEVHVYNRTKAKTDEIVAKGAIWEDSPAEIAKKCDVVFTMVGFPKDVEETYLGEKGLVGPSIGGDKLPFDVFQRFDAVRDADGMRHPQALLLKKTEQPVDAPRPFSRRAGGGFPHAVDAVLGGKLFSVCHKIRSFRRSAALLRLGAAVQFVL